MRYSKEKVLEAMENVGLEYACYDQGGCFRFRHC